MNVRLHGAGRLGRAAMLCFGCTAIVGCGGDDDPGRVSVALEFPSDAAVTRTATVHLWVLASAEEMSPSCTALVAEETHPYDVAFRRLADVVFHDPAGEDIGADVPDGPALVYVEAVDFVGIAHLAGCAPVEVAGGADVVVPLRAPGTFDCADSSVENGAPCDDGNPCTAGEECRSGSCTGGSERSCAHLDDACNSASCDPTIGCVAEPLPDLTPCDDGFFCTSGEVCMSGECVGAETDCSDEVPQCYAGICNEIANGCDAVPVSGETCDDGNACTATDTCSSGVCDGSPLTGPLCDDGDACTMNTTCQAGVCAGGAPTDMDGDGHASLACGGLDCNDSNDAAGMAEDPDNTESTATANCADGFDNDCDGLRDANDPDC